MKRIACFIAAAALAAGASTAAQAACAARDLAGTWQFYNTWHDDTPDIGWSRCVVEMDKTGAILDILDCEDSDSAAYDPDILPSTLTITPDCVVTGEILFDGGLDPDEAFEFTHATMTPRKQLIAGVGGDLDAPDGIRVTNWTFVMIAK